MVIRVPALAAPGRTAAAAFALAAFALAAVALAPAPAPAAERADGPAIDNGAVVIMYHRFGEAQHPNTNIRLEQFERHLAELSKDKYTVLPLPEIVSALKRGEPLPERAVAITVDDAYASFWEEAVPRLEEAGFPFTLFVATEPVGGQAYMTWDELRALSEMELATIGSQTHSHPHMPAQPPEANRAEVREAQARFEEELGRAPSLLAYPYGEYSARVQRLVREAGFDAAFGQQSGAIGRTSELFGLPRFTFNEQYGGLDRFRLAVNAQPLPVHEVVPEDPKLTGEENPPMYGFTVDPAVGSLTGLSCYADDRGEVPVKTLGGQRVEVRLDAPFPPGRARVNCTLRAPSGRWRWFGRQFYVAGP